ncbi:MAG: hypothetical protein E7387_00045 [Ruminococcaceae bacterium]|nr:hypothetical protein [Oscillospiraceae bacterium]
MNEDLNEKIKEIGSLFGIEEMPDNIGNIVESFISGNSGTESNHPEEPEILNETTENGLDFDIGKYVQIMNKLKKAQNNNDDKKIKLLYAIEPFLNGKRKDKVSSCVKFLTFANIAKDLKLF